MKLSEAIILILFLIGAIGFFVYFKSNDDLLTPGDAAEPNNILVEYEMAELIQVTSPEPNQLISSPVIIEGRARGVWFFEASFPVKLVDENDNLIVQSFVMTSSDWMTTDFVPFRSELEFDAPEAETGALILQNDNPSDIAEYQRELRIPVRFSESEMIQVQVFFGNSEYDPGLMDSEVFPAERLITKTQAVARAAVEELLKGPTVEEKDEGFFTSINKGVTIQKLSLEDGVAKVDFNEQLDFQVAGSARVGAIRRQITQTLTQFPTVEEVIISINGRTEDILQP